MYNKLGLLLDRYRFRRQQRFTVAGYYTKETVLHKLEAMEYRNELAHTGIIIYVRHEIGKYRHFPMLGLDNPRVQNKSDLFIPVNISARSVVSEDKQFLSYQNWVFRIANTLPPGIGSLMFQPTNKKIDRIAFLTEHKNKIEKDMIKRNKSSLKKVDKFIDSLTE